MGAPELGDAKQSDEIQANCACHWRLWSMKYLEGTMNMKQDRRLHMYQKFDPETVKVTSKLPHNYANGLL